MKMACARIQSHQQFLATVRTILTLCWAVVFTCAVAPCSFAQQRSLNDWQLLLNQLRQQIEQDSQNYPQQTGLETYKNSCHPYVVALQVFARDRDEAFKAAQEAQLSKDPKVKAFFDQFMDLVDRAQAEGNGVLGLGSFLLRVEDNFGPIPGATLTLRAGTDGKCVYDKARELKFDYSITRGQVQNMLDKALDDLDNGWSLRCGETHGNQYCGWMYPDLQRDPDPEVVEHRHLEDADKVRELSPYFELAQERQRADDLMNRYLKDALCLLPDKGHKWYLQVAEQYKLSSASEYIRGFYGTLKGTVQWEEGGGRWFAEGAHVVVTDPKDGTKWETDTDKDGRYTITMSLLHAPNDEKSRPRCPRFRISATWQGCRGDDTFAGPLMTPNPDKVFAKDVIMSCVKGDAFLEITKRETESRVFHDQNTSGKYDDLTEATVSLTLAQDMTVPNPVQNEILEYYRTTSVKLERFQKLTRGETHTIVHSKDCTTEYSDYEKVLGQQEGLDGGYTNIPSVVIIYLDAKTQKAKKVVIISVGLKFQKTINKDSISTGCHVTSHHETHLEMTQFYIAPVADYIPDPTFNPNGMADFLRELSKRTGSQKLPPIKGPKQESIHPEFVVKSGDGKTSLGGEGRVLKEDRGEKGSSRIERIYQWQMTRRKKR